jgi:hypothetical protein
MSDKEQSNENLFVSVWARYDVNGSFADYEVIHGLHTPPANSMFKLVEHINVIHMIDVVKQAEKVIEYLNKQSEELAEDNFNLECELENLTEQNRLLTIRINEKKD